MIEKGIEAGADYIPDVIEGPLRKAFSIDVPKSKASKPKASLAVNPTPRPALPAPPKQLALPAPGPKLPRFAAKTKGGQWFIDKSIGGRTASDLGVKVVQIPGDDGRWVVMNDKTPMIFAREDEARAKAQSLVDEANPNRSPENAARRIADNSLRLARDASGPLSELQNWFLRAAPRYIKNEMGTPDDPMRALAERGALHIEMSPDEWSEAASGAISREPIGMSLGLDQLYNPAGSDPRAGYDYGAALALNMPWLKKAPVTDELYGISDTYALQDKMGMSHLLDEMRNAMDPRSGLPSDLAVRPESLGRMGLAQAAERVGLINQFRVKEMERAALDTQNNPAVQTFKEYTENNPMGLRWAELKAPDDIPEGYSVRLANDAPREGYFGAYGPDGQPIAWGPTEEGMRRTAIETPLQQALDYEGNTMGHCVGGYCPDVMEGRSRIFSLRDAKGEPHVTIETAPVRTTISDSDYLKFYQEAAGQLGMPAPRSWNDMPEEGYRELDTLARKLAAEYEGANAQGAQDIVQIKGKQNRAPKDDYLPFVQDFVKSGQWGNVGDLGNTGLVKLPDGRYISEEQMTNLIENLPPEADVGVDVLSGDPREWSDNTWNLLHPHFEGYAIGGRVSADRCFSKGKSAVYAVNKSRK